MKKISLIALLTLMMTVVNFRSFSQENTVLVVGQKTPIDFTIKVVNPEYEESENTYKYKDSSFFVLLKRELDHWINSGYKIVDSSTAGDRSQNFEVIYVLLKDED